MWLIWDLKVSFYIIVIIIRDVNMNGMNGIFGDFFVIMRCAMKGIAIALAMAIIIIG